MCKLELFRDGYINSNEPQQVRFDVNAGNPVIRGVKATLETAPHETRHITMSRKPDNPKNGTENKAKTHEVQSHPPGRRFTGNGEILRLESEMVANGKTLDNRAIPVEHHEMNNEYAREEITRLVDKEVAKEHPNKELIGYLNEVKAEL